MSRQSLDAVLARRNAKQNAKVAVKQTTKKAATNYRDEDYEDEITTKPAPSLKSKPSKVDEILNSKLNEDELFEPRPKTASKQKSKEVEDDDQFSNESNEESYEPRDSRDSRDSREPEDQDIDEELQEEPREREPIKSRGRAERAERTERTERAERQESKKQTKSRESRDSRDEQEAEVIPKASLLRLLRSSGVSGMNSDVIIASKEVLENILNTVIQEGVCLTSDKIRQHITEHFKEGEDELPEEVQIAPTAFDRFVRPFFQAKQASFKRDASYLLHLFCEAYLIKMVRGADMIAACSKRSRISGGDIAVAYHIYNM